MKKLLVALGCKSEFGNRTEGNSSTMLSVPQTSPVTVSETGRPKVALRRGRSMMDWIRLTSSRSSKATIHSAGINHRELQKHSNVNDCWILLGDKVYDVTEYLAFHPGGIQQLMRAAGTDATNLFHEYHSWVNYETILKTCLIGTFIGDRTQLSTPKSMPNGEETILDDISFEAAEVKAEANSDGQLRVSCSRWSQLRDENVSIEFREQMLRLLLHFCSGETSALQWSKLPKTIFHESFRVRVDKETISLCCRLGIDINDISEHWSLGTYHSKAELEYRNCEIYEMLSITHDISSVIVRMPSFCRLMVPIGHHVMLRICSNGSLVERPYTPVVISEDGQFISFMIKFYKDGVFTPRLRSKKCGDSIEISDPLGCYDAWSDCADVVLMLAAGTGLTPMIRIASERLKINKMTILLLFNKKMVDIVSDDYLTKCKIPLEHPLLKIIHCLSEPEPQWNGEKGIISKQLISKYIDGNVEQTSHEIFICGPNPFIDHAAKLLDELEIARKNIHIFQG